MFPGVAVGGRAGRGSGAARGRVRSARRGRRAAAGAELGRPEAAGARRRRPPPHEAPPQGAARRSRETPQSPQESREESQEKVNPRTRPGQSIVRCITLKISLNCPGDLFVSQILRNTFYFF